MADKKVLTWEQKLEQGIPLNELEETKYAATRATLRRIEEQEAERKFAAEKKSNTLKPLVAAKETSK
jgi:hypothetical protein